MKVFDSSNSLIGDVIYLEDVSVNLWSSKTLFVIAERDSIYVSVYDSTNVKVCKINNDDLEFVDGATFLPVKQLDNGSYLYEVAIAARSENAKEIVTSLTLNDQGNMKQYLVKCSVVEEDDRFEVLLANNKFTINESFLKAFKETDIDEHFENQILLNQKRQELLIELFGIKSFIGTYAGLIDALKYFGYDNDVILKEFWTYFDTTLNNYVLSSHDIEKDVSQLPIGFTKTNMFNITYKFNDVLGDDDDGTGYRGDSTLNATPIIVSNFDSVITALIKMHNLRNILETYFLPAHAIIVEIVGEYLNFKNSALQYYIHNAIIHYYTTEISNIVSVTKRQESHEYQAVILNKRHEHAVAVDDDTNCFSIYKVVTNTNEYDNNLYMHDNFAYVTFKFSDDYVKLLQNIKIEVTDSKDNAILEYESFLQAQTIGFLDADDYTINIIMTDKYNVLHVHHIKASTFFVKHNFDVFTTYNKLSVPHIEERTSFKSTKEAFEYFKWYKAATAKLSSLTATRYSGLDIVNSVDSVGSVADEVGIANFYDYENSFDRTFTQLHLLDKYRYVQDLDALPNDFYIDVNKHRHIDAELYRFLNKSYYVVHCKLEPLIDNVYNANIEFKVNGTTYKVKLTGLTNLSNNKVRATIISDTLKQIGHAFDVYAFDVYRDRETKDKDLYLMFASRQLVDVSDFKFEAISKETEYQFKNVIANNAGYCFIELDSRNGVVVSSNRNVEIQVDGISYSSNVQITDVNDVVKFFEGLPAYLGKFSVVKLSATRVYVSSDKNFVIADLSYDNVISQGSLRPHVVDKLIKLAPGSKIKNYSIFFAKINEFAKCRPHNIKWTLYEQDGNDTNIVKESTDYFFTHVMTSKSTYTLELSYYESKSNMHQSKNQVVVRKPGIVIVDDSFDTLIEPFVLSNNYPDL